MSDFIVFTGGAFETNAYLIPTAGGHLCVDAPEGVADEIARRGLKIRALLLTHGHFDHYWDAAAVIEQHDCPVWCHAADRPMLEQPELFASFVPPGLLRAVHGARDYELPEKGRADWVCAGIAFTLFHLPGHSPGSVAFYRGDTQEVFGGDVLFAGGVGRWDLPGGSREELVSGIRTHLLSLPDPVKVHPGHGPSTTIGRERRSNAYLQT